MNREEMHSKVDELYDKLEAAREKADKKLYDVKIEAEVKAQDVQNAACRGKNLVQSALIDSAVSGSEFKERFELARNERNWKLAEKCMQGLEKVSADMLAFAQDAVEKAGRAAAEAEEARRAYHEEFIPGQEAAGEKNPEPQKPEQES